MPIVARTDCGCTFMFMFDFTAAEVYSLSNSRTLLPIMQQFGCLLFFSDLTDVNREIVSYINNRKTLGCLV